jgi:hypothetical protein
MPDDMTEICKLIISARTPYKVSVIEIGSAEDWQMMANELSVPSYARWMEIWATYGIMSMLIYPPERSAAPEPMQKLLALKLPPPEKLLFGDENAPDGSADRNRPDGPTAEVQEGGAARPGDAFADPAGDAVPGVAHGSKPVADAARRHRQRKRRRK